MTDEWARARVAIDALHAKGGRLGRPLVIERQVGSTNDLAKEGARAGALHGATWVCEEQTGGRGRQGRSWVSPSGENLLFSLLLRPACRHERVPLTAIVAGVCVAESLVSFGLPARLKWPNDVLIDGRKIAGILVEAVTRGRTLEAVVVGIGLNVHSRKWPTDIEARATSCALEAERVAERGGKIRVPDRGEILADVLARMDREVEDVLARGLGLMHARLAALDALVGVRVRTDHETGIARGIDDEGRLVVEREDGVRTTWVSGEVHLGHSAERMYST